MSLDPASRLRRIETALAAGRSAVYPDHVRRTVAALEAGREPPADLWPSAVAKGRQVFEAVQAMRASVGHRPHEN